MSFVYEADRWKEGESLTSKIPISHSPPKPSHLENPDLQLTAPLKQNKVGFNCKLPRFEPLTNEIPPVEIILPQKKPNFDEFQDTVKPYRHIFEEHVAHGNKPFYQQSFTKALSRDEVKGGVFEQCKNDTPGPGHYNNLEPQQIKHIISLQKSSKGLTDDLSESDWIHDKFQQLKLMDNQYRNRQAHARDTSIPKEDIKEVELEVQKALKRHKSSHQINRVGQISSSINESKSGVFHDRWLKKVTPYHFYLNL